MITVNLHGGLGNLMFEYAYGRALQEELGDKLEFNAQYINLISLWLYHRPDTKNNLLHLTLNDSVRWKSPLTGYAEGIIDGIHSAFYSYYKRGELYHGKSSFEKASRKGYLFSLDAITYYRYAGRKNINRKVIGLWQSEKYFKNIEDIIRKEFVVKTPPSSENQKMINELKMCNSVCVHIRRGDYLTAFNAKELVVCNNAYFNAGMKYIADRTENPVFYIFTNDSKDVKWIQENYHFDYPVKYVDLNNPNYEELRLMYTCKHFVISNSTFSWWGSYLATNPCKITVAPSIWLNGYTAPQDILLRDDIVKIGELKQ